MSTKRFITLLDVTARRHLVNTDHIIDVARYINNLNGEAEFVIYLTNVNKSFNVDPVEFRRLADAIGLDADDTQVMIEKRLQ